jgi:hypothetical protein
MLSAIIPLACMPRQLRLSISAGSSTKYHNTAKHSEIPCKTFIKKNSAFLFKYWEPI